MAVTMKKFGGHLMTHRDERFLGLLSVPEARRRDARGFGRVSHSRAFAFSRTHATVWPQTGHWVRRGGREATEASHPGRDGQRGQRWLGWRGGALVVR